MSEGKTAPVLPGNRPDYTAQEGIEFTEYPRRLISPIYPENIVRTVICVSILQILNPDILFWPITVDEVAGMKEECKEHPDWFLMDLDNSVEKLIARIWSQFGPNYFVSRQSASKVALDLGRAIDRECSTVNSVLVNMIYSLYTDLEREGIIYSTGNVNMLKMLHTNDDPETVRNRISEAILEISKPVQALVDKFIRSINDKYAIIEKVEHEIKVSNNAGRNWVCFESYFPIDAEAKRLLLNDPKIDWVIQAVPGCWTRQGFFLLPVSLLGTNSPLKTFPKAKFIEWVENNDAIVQADPNTREAIWFRTSADAVEGIKTLESYKAEA